MPHTRTPYTSYTEIVRSENLKIGMIASLGIGVAVAIITCTIIYGRADATAISNVGKILIDTDAGADDAVAILMALEAENINGEQKVVAITCVNGNTYVDNVALNVLKTLKVIDRLDIPVYKGANQPLLLNNEKTNYFGNDGFGDFEYPDPPSIELLKDLHAVIAMIELVRANPGEVTLLALGPLTNVALAIRIYSSFLDDLQQLIILGGSSEGVGNTKPGIEFNFSIDPAANYIVFNASTSKPAILVPYETTFRAKRPMGLRTSFNETSNPKIWLINSAESASLNPENEHWECADAVATAVALTSGAIVTRSKSIHLDAIYEGPLTAGMIAIDHMNNTLRNPNTYLIQDIDVETFEEMLVMFLN